MRYVKGLVLAGVVTSLVLFYVVSRYTTPVPARFVKIFFK